MCERTERTGGYWSVELKVTGSEWKDGCSAWLGESEDCGVRGEPSGHLNFGALEKDQDHR